MMRGIDRSYTRILKRNFWLINYPKYPFKDKFVQVVYSDSKIELKIINNFDKLQI